MAVKDVIKALSHAQREMLIAHVRDPQPIDFTAGTPSDRNTSARTRSALIEQALLRYGKSGSPYTGDRGTQGCRLTVLTELGREVVAGVLGEYADALVLAGCLTRAPAVSVVARLPDRETALTES